MIKKTLCSLLLFWSLTSSAQNRISDILKYDDKVEKLNIGSEEVAYIEKGSGKKTLLFIHGLSSNLESWRKNISSLEEDYRSIAVDLPGYGKSSRNKTDYSLKDYATYLIDFIEAKELNDVTLVGHSMGGQIAIHTVLHSPDLFNDLILIAPAGIETFNEQEGTAMKMAYTPQTVENSTEEQIRNNYRMNFHSFPEDAEFMVEDRIAMKEAEDFAVYAEIVVNNVHAMLDEPVFDRLQEISVPVLMIYGKEDLLIPNRYLHPAQDINSLIETAKEKIPNLEVRLVDDAGHFVNFEKPTEVNRAIRDFLKNG